MSESQESRGPGERPRREAPAEGGFTLIMALLVMGLLTTLGLALLFTAETDRTISRNYYGTIQATYAAEAAVEATTRALLFDLKNDQAGGWRNRWLVVCDASDPTVCQTKYGFNPTLAACYNAGNANQSCVVKDVDGSRAGVPNNWVANLAYRPGLACGGLNPDDGCPLFPSQQPVRVHRALGGVDTVSNTNGVMPWWQRFRIDPANTTNLYNLPTGGKQTTTILADIVLTSVCARDCVNSHLVRTDDAATQRTKVDNYLRDEIYVTGVGQSPFVLAARIARTKNPATRAVGYRVRGSLVGLWENALVAGAGLSGDPSIVRGELLVRGSTMVFGNGSIRTAFDFTAANTGIVNNWYDSDSVPAIDPWWWLSARSCGTPFCDSNDSANGPFDSTVDSETLEPVVHHLPDPPDVDPTDATNRGGYAASNSDYPGPEGLNSTVRVRNARINIAHADARVGRAETLEGGPSAPGRFLDNLLDLFLNDTEAQTTPPPHDDSLPLRDVTGDPYWENVWQKEGADYDARRKSGPYDIEGNQLAFPDSTDDYVEPVTGIAYGDYYSFLRSPAGASPRLPGGWALRLDGVSKGASIPTNLNYANSGSHTCWPRGCDRNGDLDCADVGESTADASPSTTDLQNAFGTSGSPKKVRLDFGCTADYYYNSSASPANGDLVCGNTTYPYCPANIGLTQVASPANADSCTIPLTRVGASTDPDCPAQIDIRLFRRRIGPSIVREIAAPFLLDSSSSIDIPPQRSRRTHSESYAFALYHSIKDMLDNTICSSSVFNVWLRNFTDIPTEFTASIPADLPPSSTGAGSCSADVPCFRERSVYMDVHIQFPDVPYIDRADASADGTRRYAVRYTPNGRWLSIRMRNTPNINQGSTSSTSLTVLADHRSGRNSDWAALNACASLPGFNPVTNTTTHDQRPPDTDIADEVIENEGGNRWNVIPNNTGLPAGGPGDREFRKNWRHTLKVPFEYDIARAEHPEDRQFRNAPTGVFIIALHLPCTDDTSSGNFRNPYKCAGRTNSPGVAYPGFYTHLVGWIPKYAVLRTNGETWAPATAGNGPPSVAPAYTCTTLSGTVAARFDAAVAGRTVGQERCPTAPTRQTAWWAESLWMANMTTLWNGPLNGNGGPSFPRGTRDVAHDTGATPNTLRPAPGVTNPAPTLLGFKLNVPMTLGSVDDGNPAPPAGAPGSAARRTPWPPFRQGIDRRVFIDDRETCSGSRFYSCTPESDGNRCNSDQKCSTSATGCGGSTAALCQDEPDFFNSGGAYGGCTEIMSPLSALRVQELDPSAAASPFYRGAGLTPTGCSGGPCSDGSYGRCVARGVDPDWLGRYDDYDDADLDDDDYNRYGRGWPGWSSANTLLATGLLLSEGNMLIGAPAPKLESDMQFRTPVARTQWNNAAFDNCTTVAPCDGTAGQPACCAWTGVREGYWSDPIVYDGRAIMFVGTGTRETPCSGGFGCGARVTIYDHLVPRGRMGCSDFLSIISNGNMRVDMDQPYDAATPKMLIGAHLLAYGYLNNISPTNVNVEFAGSVMALGANLGTGRTTPVQFIGTPTISGPPIGESTCDHVYLPYRQRVAVGSYLNFVEDETLPPGF